MSVSNLSESAEAAAELFSVFSDERPDLIPLGIDEIDKDIGGMFKGTLVVLAMDTGVGKSRFVLGSALRFGEVCEVPGARVGIISVEDGEDVVGARLLAWASGVDSLRIRRKAFVDGDLEKLEHGMEVLRSLDEAGNAPVFAYRIGGSLEDILSAARELGEAGCKVIWLDYLQKVRGVSDDRRGEIGRVLTEFQRECANAGAVAGVVSQFSRRQGRAEPQLHHLKESGDIENEARLALLGWKADLNTGEDIVALKVAKSTFGYAGRGTFYRRTAESGMLEPWEMFGG